jgi:hypothetical protein
MGLLGMNMPGMGGDEAGAPETPEQRKKRKKERLREGLKGILGQ